MIGVIDYDAGNAPSVMYALQRMGISAKFVRAASDFTGIQKIILPGVGAAKATIASLHKNDLLNKLGLEVLQSKMPYLGICVGSQIIFEKSEEENAECLGWLKGIVVKYDATKVRIPQIGWNEVFFRKTSDVFRDLGNSSFFYFVNSYYIKPVDQAAIAATAVYDHEFCAAISVGNITATQFHIEKSGEIGLRVLRNFCRD